jgi:hypothetical protein
MLGSSGYIPDVHENRQAHEKVLVQSKRCFVNYEDILYKLHINLEGGYGGHVL